MSTAKNRYLKLMQRLWRELSLRRRWQLIAISCGMAVSSITQVALVASIMPLLTGLSKSTYSNNYNYLYMVCILFALLAVFSSFARSYSFWLNAKLSALVGTDLNNICLRRSIRQPFISHLQRSSVDVITGLAQVNQVVGGIISPLLQMLTCFLTILGAFITVMILSWQATLLVCFLFISAYILIARIFQLPLQRNGDLLLILWSQELRVLQECLNGFRDMILDGSEDIHLLKYHKTISQIRMITAQNAFMQSSPKFAIEAIGYVSLSITTIFLAINGSDLVSVLPLLGAFALAAQTMLPNLQQIYSCWGSLNSSFSSLQKVINLLDQSDVFCSKQTTEFVTSPVAGIFRSALVFKNVSFQYTSLLPDVLSDLSFDINKGDYIGIAGLSGSGKSTLVDILMGLLEPSTGAISIDGTILGSDDLPLSTWRKVVSHVPQHLFIIDSTLAENILFGAKSTVLDTSLLAKSISIAQLDALIEELPEGLDTQLGEGGIRLSGGQRQRIGIARAIYRSESFLVLDEATSALDSITESKVLSGIKNLGMGLTIVMITHRMMTLRNCNKILVLDKGKMVAYDTYDSLMLKCNLFSRLVSGAEIYE